MESDGGRFQMLVLSLCRSLHTSMPTHVQICMYIYIHTPHARTHGRKRHRGTNNRVVPLISLCPGRTVLVAIYRSGRPAAPSLWTCSLMVKTCFVVGSPQPVMLMMQVELTHTLGFPWPEIPCASEPQCADLPSFPLIFLFPPSQLTHSRSGPLFWEPRSCLHTTQDWAATFQTLYQRWKLNVFLSDRGAEISP